MKLCFGSKEQRFQLLHFLFQLGFRIFFEEGKRSSRYLNQRQLNSSKKSTASLTMIDISDYKKKVLNYIR